MLPVRITTEQNAPPAKPAKCDHCGIAVSGLPHRCYVHVSYMSRICPVSVTYRKGVVTAACKDRIRSVYHNLPSWCAAGFRVSTGLTFAEATVVNQHDTPNNLLKK
jgi:hypothetical protein